MDDGPNGRNGPNGRRPETQGLNAPEPDAFQCLWGASISSIQSISSIAFSPYSVTTHPSGPLTKRAVVMSFFLPVRGTVMSISTSQT